jgi:hypothetical protein
LAASSEARAGIAKATGLDERDGCFLEGGEFLPAGRFDLGFGETFSSGAEVEPGFDEEVAHFEELGGMPVGPGEMALDRLDREEAAKGRRRQAQKEGAPEELRGLGRGDGEPARREPGGSKKVVRRDHERRQHRGLAGGGVAGESFAQSAAA